MRTVVIQSAAPDHSSTWIGTCVNSVRAWADARGWNHVLSGDEFFDWVPHHLRDKFNAQKPLLSDIARLTWALSLFAEDSALDRVVWLDADVLVFAPDRLALGDTISFGVGRQIWVQPDSRGKLKIYRQVHNAILVMHRSSTALPFLKDAALKIAERHDGPAAGQLLGPKLITALHNIASFDVIDAVGMASPLVVRDIAAGGGGAVEALRRETGNILAAVNLCASYRGKAVDGVQLPDTLFENAVSHLLTTGNL